MALDVIQGVYKIRSENRERLRTQVLRDVSKALGKLLCEVRFEEAYVFGSLTRPYRFSEVSDIDIAFKGLDRDMVFFVAGFLSRELERDVSVVDIERVHFKHKILQEGIKWKQD